VTKSKALRDSRALVPFGPALALVALAAGLSLACSDADPEPVGAGAAGGAGGSGGSTSFPNAQPCGISTGFDGDQYCINAPDTAAGMQLHYGPKDYNNQAEVDRFLLYPGEEKTDCMFVTTTNTTEVFFRQYHARMRPGSHHMLLYLQDARRPESTGPEACRQGLDTRNIFGAQTLTLDVGNVVSGPENDGLAIKLEPNQQGVVQMHFINTGDKPILREGWANLVYVDPSQVKQLGDPIFWLGGLGMNVQPGVREIIKGKATAPADGIRLVAATGHFHAHTVRFSAWKTIGGGPREPLMDDYDWHEPTLVRFDSTTKNKAPDPVAKKAGGFSGIVALNTGDVIDWECEVMNDGQVPLTFGNEVYTAEMCNVFGLYAPTTGAAWRATN
jgi:hypothetical protein